MTTRQNSLERVWFVAVIGWSIIRVIFADVFFAKYGINIWIFAGVEALTSPIFARSTAKMVIALSEHRLKNSLIWGTMTLASFGAPDIYLLTTGKNLPWIAYFVVVGIMVVAGSSSAIRMNRKARALSNAT